MTAPVSSGCPKFDTCDASLCPLDDWARHHHLDGEPVCLYLREAAKRAGILKSDPYIPRELAEKVSLAYPAIVSRWGDIRRRLVRAALSPSKIKRPGAESWHAAA